LELWLPEKQCGGIASKMATLEIIVVAVLILLNGYLAMCELAIVSSRRSHLERLADGGHPGADAALVLANDPGRFLASLQIGITSVAVLTGTFSGVTLAHRLDDWLDGFPTIAPYSKPVAFALIVISVTFLSLLFGELVPKQIALKNPEALAIRLARPLVAFTRIAAPVVWVLNASANLVLRVFGVRAGFERRLTDEDIASVLIEGEKSGLIHAAEREMIEDVLDLADSPVSAIMTPRPDVIWLNVDGPEAATIKAIRECPYAQLLACRGTLDNVAGIVRKQDLLNQSLDGRSLDITQSLQSPLAVPERTSILRTLEVFRKTPVNTAIVIDEFGTVQGIVTRTDLLEAVAGRLPDVDAKPEPKISRQQDGSFLIDAATPVGDVVARLGLKEPQEPGLVTVAGLVLSKLDRGPQPGARVSYDGWDFEILEVDGARIKRLLVFASKKQD
jgi:putative hemolysin